ncbi:MAG: mntB 1 [Phycisphaerales bacterium]|nr:mntB 1 [Phycisphaerales bacterium]
MLPDPFFYPLLFTAAALAIAAGVTGTFVLLRREALVAMAVPQVVAIGAALSLRYAWPKLPPALIAVALALALLAWARHRKLDSLLPCLYVAGVSISFLIIANSGAHVNEMQNLFVGIDVAVTPDDARLVIVPVLIAALLCALFWRRWLLLAQSPTTAQLARLHPIAWQVLFLSMLGVVLLLGTNALGVVMILALLFLPAATALPWARRIPTALALAAVIGLIDVYLGFQLSNRMEWPFSHSVGGVGFAILMLSHLAALPFRA